MADDWDDDDDTDVPAEWARDVHALRRTADETRVNMDEADLAMRLIRDRTLALAIAKEAPAGPERVALAVGDGDLPPLVIVGRIGSTYTATVLGRGMPPKAETPVVGFDRVRMHVERADLFAERRAAAEGLWKDRSGVRQLLERCDNAGARLAREDFEQLAALAPILEGRYLAKATEAFGRVLRAAPHIIRLKRFPSSIEHKLVAFWNRFHAVGNYTLLASVRGKESFAMLERAEVSSRLEAQGFEPYRHLYFQPLRLGQGYVALRVFAALGRAGEAAIPTVKAIMAEAPTAVRWMFGAYALIAIGRRHRKLRVELAHAIGLSKLPPFMRQEASAAEVAKTMQTTMEALWAEPGAGGDVEDANMRRLAEALARDIHGEESLLVTGDALSFARLATMPCNFLRFQQDVSSLSLAVAFCAEVPPEELYFPAASTALAPAFSAEAAKEYAYVVPPPTAPVRAVEKPGRNELCKCGSGKKWKRCCGMN